MEICEEFLKLKTFGLLFVDTVYAVSYMKENTVFNWCIDRTIYGSSDRK